MKTIGKTKENLYRKTDAARMRGAVSERTGAEKRQFRFSGIAAFTAALIIVFGLLITGGFQSLAQDESDSGKTYYKSITIERGDTLWNIAEEYITDDYESIEEYVSALKSMNNLKSDKILFGDKLIIAYNPE